MKNVLAANVSRAYYIADVVRRHKIAACLLGSKDVFVLTLRVGYTGIYPAARFYTKKASIK